MNTLIRHTIEGKAVPIRGSEIDTDRIVPARFLKEVTFERMGEFLFYDVRYDDGEEEMIRPDSPTIDTKTGFKMMTGIESGRNPNLPLPYRFISYRDNRGSSIMVLITLLSGMMRSSFSKFDINFLSRSTSSPKNSFLATKFQLSTSFSN